MTNLNFFFFSPSAVFQRAFSSSPTEGLIYRQLGVYDPAVSPGAPQALRAGLLAGFSAFVLLMEKNRSQRFQIEL